MAITKTSTLADTIPTVISEARFIEQFRSVMAGLVWNIRKELHKGSTVNIPYWGVVTASALSEGVDMSSPSTMADTNVPITPAEYGCQILLTDKLVRDDQEDVKAAAGRILGDAMALLRDTTLLALFVSGTPTVCATTTTLTMGHLAAAQALLRGNAVSAGGPAPQPYVVVHHPYTLLDLVDVVTPLTPGIDLAVANTNISVSPIGTSFTDDIIRNYGIGRLFGMNIVEDGNIIIGTTHGTAANDAVGGIFSAGKGGSIILVTAKDWDVVPEYDASLRATELNIVGEYGAANYLNAWVVKCMADAATPA